MYWRLTPFGCRVVCKLSHLSVAFCPVSSFLCVVVTALVGLRPVDGAFPAPAPLRHCWAVGQAAEPPWGPRAPPGMAGGTTSALTTPGPDTRAPLVGCSYVEACPSPWVLGEAEKGDTCGNKMELGSDKQINGLPGGASGKEPTCQRKRHKV